MVLHCSLENDCKRSQLSSSSVSLFANVCARNFTSSIVIYKTKWCRSSIVPPVPYMSVSSRFTFIYPTRLVIMLFIFYFYNTRGLFNSYLLQATIFEHSKRYFCIQFLFYFSIQVYFSF